MARYGRSNFFRAEVFAEGVDSEDVGFSTPMDALEVLIKQFDGRTEVSTFLSKNYK